MKGMKKLIASLLVILMLAGCGGGQGGGGGTSDGTKIRVLTHMSSQISAIKETFEQETGITVEVDNCSFDDLNDQYEVLLSSGSSEYDVLIVDGPNTAAYVSRGYLAPLDQYFTKDEINAFSGALVDQGTVNDSFYAAPMGDSCTVMYYNKDLLKEAGVSWDFDQYDGVNSRITWEELIDLATQVTSKLDPDGSKGITPVEFGQASQVYMMNTIPNSLGAPNISEDGLSVSGVIDSPEWTEALNWYQKNVSDGIFSRGVNGFEGYNNFYAGKSVFILMTTDSYNYALEGGMTPENLGFTYQPCFKGHEKEVATACGNWTAAINVNSKNQESAGKFVNWITYGAGNDLFLRQESMVPNMASRFTDDLYEVNPALKIASVEAGVTSVARAVTPGFNEYSTALSSMWEDIRNGTDISSAVSSAISTVDSAMDIYK